MRCSSAELGILTTFGGVGRGTESPGLRPRRSRSISSSSTIHDKPVVLPAYGTFFITAPILVRVSYTSVKFGFLMGRLISAVQYLKKSLVMVDNPAASRLMM